MALMGMFRRSLYCCLLRHGERRKLSSFVPIQCHHLVVDNLHRVGSHPIVIMASLFWQLLVQMAILSPLGLTLTTAPHTSSLASSNDSPTKHKSWNTRDKNDFISTTLFILSFDPQLPSGHLKNK